MPHANNGEHGPRVSAQAKPSTGVQGATIVLSVVLHAVVAGGVFWAFRSLQQEPVVEEVAEVAAAPGGSTVGIELPVVVGEGVQRAVGPVDPMGDPPRIGGGTSVARLDQGTAGTGGDPGVRAPALNLADRDEHMRLSPDLVNRLDRDQLQRLRVARKRQSWEDRRSTTHPTELTLLVTGPGIVLERRADSPTMPSRGVEQSPAPSVRGGAPGEPGDLGEGAAPRGGAAGTLASEPGAGLMTARAGLDHRASAPIASARPDVTEGLVSVPSRDAARPRDDVDSEQEVATTVRSLVHASTAGGAAGDGQGGSAGGGEPGAGASEGAGSRGQPLGLGAGDVYEFWTNDPRLLPYFRLLHARIDPLWRHAFPKAAIMDLRQGTVILMFTVHADGQVSVQWPPVRPSGFEEFDRNCADAIRRAAPLPPIPPQLGVSSLTIRAPFVASNPVVR
jgi:TonB family protein